MKERYLNEWAHIIGKAAHGGHLPGGQMAISRIQTIPGPRAGALEISAGLDAGRLLKALSADDSAILRQFIPWSFAGEPSCFMSGRYVRVEAGWPSDLAESVICLADIGRHPKDGGRWLAGLNEHGSIVSLGLTDATPHFLIAGQTGSGKSIGMLAAASQLGVDYDNRLVLMDGKFGVDLRQVAHLPTLIGPLVVDCEGAQAALAWAVNDMRRRYEHKDPSRLIILWDEPQEWLSESDGLVEMTRRLLAQGRGANVHLIMSTQHPVVSVFGDPTSKRNLTGRIALKVSDFEASRVAVGGPSPRADRLLGAGDAYAVVPSAVHRIQGVYVDRRDFETLPSGEPMLEQWPEFKPENLGQSLQPFSPSQTAEALIAASEGVGRPTLEQRANVGSTVGRKLLAYGRDVHDALNERDYELCQVGWLVEYNAHTKTTEKRQVGQKSECVQQLTNQPGREDENE